MEKINNALETFKNNLKQIDQLSEIGSDAGDILLEMLNNLKKENEKMSAFIPYKQKLDVVINQIKNIKNHDLLIEKYRIIYNQSVVLVVATFESFMNDLVKNIIDNYPDIINWPEKKQISFDPNILKYSSPTIGSLIVGSSLREKYNFQDLQSTISFLKEYLGFDLSIEEELKEKIIKYQALRNVIIHNAAIIDDKFLKQIRDIEIKEIYKINNPVKLKEADYKEARDSFEKFSDKIFEKLEEKFK